MDKLTSDELLTNYVKFHNEGVDSYNFKKLIELFSEDAEIYFEKINFGPLIGLNSIAETFKKHPPSDKLILKTKA